MTFVDWLPGVFSIFGLLIVNLIDKERLVGDGGSFGEGSLVWRARLILFMGFALMAGGLAGSVVRRSARSSMGMTLTLLKDCARPQIYPQRIPGTVHLLWIRQRGAEHRPNAIGCSAVAGAERTQRVRIPPQPVIDRIFPPSQMCAVPAVHCLRMDFHCAFTAPLLF